MIAVRIGGNVMNQNAVSELKKCIADRQIEYIKIGVFDGDAIMRGKYLAVDKFLKALDGGLSFCDVVLGWDSNDQLFDNVSFTGWHTAYPDAPVRLLPETFRAIPNEPKTLLVLGEFAGNAESVCPRAVLRRVLARARHMGLEVQASAEFEFFMFAETPESVRAKHYQGLQSMTPGNFGYSVLRSGVHADLYDEILEWGRVMRFPIEGLHTETGPGVLEAALLYTEALEAADRAALFKTFMKILAQRRGLMATFMAKWSQTQPGQSGHLHVSLKRSSDGQAVFYDADQPHGISATMRHFIAGQQHLMPDVLAMVASTVNSYSRLVPGYWAPTSATWGVENRTTALRAITGSAHSQRVEYRIAAADINPYLALAAAIGSGLWGIEQRWEPDAPIEGNAYALTHADNRRLPSTLSDAAHRLNRCAPARALFGDAFVDHHSQTRLWEEREFHKAVTDWELKRYFEII
jgi:glutamine synthetase